MAEHYRMHLDGKAGNHLVPKWEADDDRTMAVSLCGKKPSPTSGAFWCKSFYPEHGEKTCRNCERIRDRALHGEQPREGGEG